MRRLLLAAVFFCSIAHADNFNYIKVVDVERLGQEIRSGMSKTLIKNDIIDVPVGYIDTNGANLLISFFNVLPSSAVATLNTIVENHVPTPLPNTETDGTFSFSGYNSTLGGGTTFQIFVPQDDIGLRSVSVAIIATGGPTSAHVFKCGNGGASVSVIVPGDATAGQVYSAPGNVFVVAGSTVNMWMDTTGNPSFTVNQQCTYIAQ